MTSLLESDAEAISSNGHHVWPVRFTAKIVIGMWHTSQSTSYRTKWTSLAFLFTCLLVYLRVCVCVCLCVCVCVSLFACLCVCMCLCACLREYLCAVRADQETPTRSKTCRYRGEKMAHLTNAPFPSFNITPQGVVSARRSDRIGEDFSSRC